MKIRNITRRHFFSNAGLGTAAVGLGTITIASFPPLGRSCNREPDRSIHQYFQEGDVVLFQGDSITDAGRDRNRQLKKDAASFGGGYAFLLASWLLEELPRKVLTITPAVFEEDYRSLLELTKSRLPAIRLVICEPFILPGTRVVDETWLEPFSAFQQIARNMANAFDATWVPFQEAFTKPWNMLLPPIGQAMEFIPPWQEPS